MPEWLGRPCLDGGVFARLRRAWTYCRPSAISACLPRRAARMPLRRATSPVLGRVLWCRTPERFTTRSRKLPRADCSTIRAEVSAGFTLARDPVPVNETHVQTFALVTGGQIESAGG